MPRTFQAVMMVGVTSIALFGELAFAAEPTRGRSRNSAIPTATQRQATGILDLSSVTVCGASSQLPTPGVISEGAAISAWSPRSPVTSNFGLIALAGMYWFRRLRRARDQFPAASRANPR